MTISVPGLLAGDPAAGKMLMRRDTARKTVAAAVGVIALAARVAHRPAAGTIAG